MAEQNEVVAVRGLVGRSARRLSPWRWRVSAPTDLAAEAERQLVRWEFWDLGGGGKISVTFSVVTQLAAVAAADPAQANHSDALHDGGVERGSGLATICCSRSGAWSRLAKDLAGAAG